MALIEAARNLPGVKPDRVGLFGQSRRAAVALLVASTGGDVQAVASSGAPYTHLPRADEVPPITMVKNLQAPLLMLHGTADEIVDVQQARDYERVIRELGKPVEAHYYEGAPHLLPFMPQTREDVIQRAIAFFRKHLAE